jgi:hypothetical protein
MGRMNWLFTSPGDGYGAQTILFAFSVTLFALPLATLLAASLVEELLKRRPGKLDLTYEPLALRHFKLVKGTRSP